MDWIINLQVNYGYKQLLLLSLPYIIGILVMIYKSIILEKNLRKLIFTFPLLIQVIITTLAYMFNKIDTPFSSLIMVFIPMLSMILLQISIYFKYLTLNRIIETNKIVFESISSILVPFIYLFSILLISYSIYFRPYITEILFIFAIFFIPSLSNLVIYRFTVIDNNKK